MRGKIQQGLRLGKTKLHFREQSNAADEDISSQNEALEMVKNGVVVTTFFFGFQSNPFSLKNIMDIKFPDFS
jgi:hypothetical protein